MRVRGAFALGVALLLVGSVAVRAQEVTTIEVDLNSGTLKSALPFDIPYRLKGPASPVVLRVEGWVRELPGGYVPECSTLDPESHHQPEPSSMHPLYPDANWWKFDTWTRTEASRDDTFYLSASPVRANTSYDFCFRYLRTLTEEELKRFRANLVVGLRNAFQVQGSRPDSRQALQRALIWAIPQNADRSVSPVPGSIFDTNPAGEESLRRVMGEALDFLDPLDARDNAIDRYRLSRESLEEALLDDEERERLVEIGQRVRRIAQSAPQQSGLSAPAALLVALGELDIGRAGSVASGDQTLLGSVGPPSPTRTDLRMLWVPSEVAPLQARLATSTDELRRAAALLDRLATETALRRSADLQAFTPADLQQLASRVRTLSDEVGRLLDPLDALHDALERWNAILPPLADRLVVRAQSDLLVRGSTSGTFEARAEWYFSGDLGIATVPSLDEVVPYLGVNLYLRPVNKEAPLSSFAGRERLSRSFAFMLGVTVSSIKETETGRDDLFGKSALLLGAGFRLTDSVRLTGGALLYQSQRQAPLSSRYSPEAALFGSISFDADVKSALGAVGAALFGK